MKLNQRHARKVDSLLRAALARAAGDEVFRTVMILGPEEHDWARENNGQKNVPERFPSRTAYRQTLIRQQKNRLDEYLSGTLKALQTLSLVPKGGTISRTVVVEGPARQILNSLDIPGVRHASLDQPIEFIKPFRQRQKKSKR